MDKTAKGGLTAAPAHWSRTRCFIERKVRLRARRRAVIHSVSRANDRTDCGLVLDERFETLSAEALDGLPDDEARSCVRCDDTFYGRH